MRRIVIFMGMFIEGEKDQEQKLRLYCTGNGYAILNFKGIL